MHRNNILLTFSDYGNNIDIGIYKRKKSREVIPVEDINLINLQTKIIARELLNWLKVNCINNIYNYEKDKGIFNHMAIRHNEKDEYMVELYLNECNDKVLNRLKFWNWNNYKVVSVYYQIIKNKNFRNEYNFLFGDRYLKYKIMDYVFSIKGGCFFQTNNEVLQVMYNDVFNVLNKNAEYNFLDLYCGVGILSILVNKHFKNCLGIEINPNAIEIAKFNKFNNNIKNCEFYCDKVEDFISSIKINNLVIFINPPRRGVYENVIDKLNSIKNVTIQIVYLSCCKKTLDRDLKLLNYNSEIIKEYNMFPGTEHKEYLVRLY